MIVFDIYTYEQWRNKDEGIANFIIKVLESVDRNTQFPMRITVEYGEDLEDE